MAFTEAERVKIRFYLGWSARFHQTDTRLEQAMNAIDSAATTDTEDLIRDTILVALDDVSTKLTAAHDRFKALKVGSIMLPGHGEMSALRLEGARHASSLAATLGVPVRHNVFSSNQFRDPLGVGRELPHG